jgi:hypothetical protein
MGAHALQGDAGQDLGGDGALEAPAEQVIEPGQLLGGTGEQILVAEQVKEAVASTLSSQPPT